MSFRPSAARDGADQGESTRLPPLSSLFKKLDEEQEPSSQLPLPPPPPSSSLRLQDQSSPQKVNLPQLLHPRRDSHMQVQSPPPMPSRHYSQQDSVEPSFGPSRYARRLGENESDASSGSSFASPYQNAKYHRYGGRRASLSAANAAYDSSVRSTFERLWEILLIARRHTDASEQYPPSGGPRPLPSIRNGDVPTLSSHLQYELNILSNHDSYMAERLYQEAGLAQQHSWSSSASGNSTGDNSGAFPRVYVHTPIQSWQSNDPTSDHQWTSSQREGSQYLPLPPSRSGTLDSSHGRHRTYSTHSAPTPTPRRVRKRHDEAEQSCLSCSATETPEWRKGPTGPRTLCNACGLLYAKQTKRKDVEMQASKKRPSASGSHDSMTQEEREKSLNELQIAVQARQGQSSSSSCTATTVPSSSSGDSTMD